MILKFLILFIVIVYLAAIDNNQFCINGMDTIQQQQEKKLNGEVLSSLKEIFQQEPRLISKIFQVLFNKNKEIMFQLKQKIFSKMQIYQLFLILTCSLCFIFYKSIPPLINFYKYTGKYVAHQRLKKIGTILIIILCLFVVLQSYRGIRQSQKHKKNINYFLCRVLEQPTNIVKGQSLDGINELQKYVEQALRNFMEHFMVLKPALLKLQTTKQMIETASLILNNLSNSNSSSSIQYGKRLTKARNDLMIAYNYSIKRPRTLYDAYRIPNRILQASLLVNSFTKSIKYIQSEFNLQRIISMVAKTSSLFFYFVGLVAFTTAIVLTTLNKGTVDYRDKYLHWLQYSITVILVTCLAIYLAASFLLPTLFWTSNATQFAFSNQANFLQEFKLLNHFNPQVPQSISMIIPINRKVIKMYFGHFQNETKTLIEALAPYTHQNATYFYKLYHCSLKYISSKQASQKIQHAIDQHYIKEQNFIEQIKNAHQSLTNILKLYQQGGSLQKIDGNIIGRYLTNLLALFFQLTQNRLYTIKQITKQLGIYFLIILLLTFTAEQKISNQIHQDKSEERGIDLSEIY